MACMLVNGKQDSTKRDKIIRRSTKYRSGKVQIQSTKYKVQTRQSTNSKYKVLAETYALNIGSPASRNRRIFDNALKIRILGLILTGNFLTFVVFTSVFYL